MTSQNANAAFIDSCQVLNRCYLCFRDMVKFNMCAHHYNILVRYQVEGDRRG